jgi:hypothetical protein
VTVNYRLNWSRKNGQVLPGSLKGKEKAVEEPEKWDMAKGYKNLKDDDADDKESQAKKEKLCLARVVGHVTGYEPCMELHGSWAEFTVNMIEDWMCLYEVAINGDRHPGIHGVP